MTEFTIPGLSDKQGSEIADLLQKPLSTYNDLHLTLKHVHWNVVGPNFIGVHEMIDPQVELVRGYADDVAERIAALGKSPTGHARRDHQGPHLGRLLGRAGHRAGAPGRARSRLHRCDRGSPQGHRPPRRSRPGVTGPRHRSGRRDWRSSSGSSARTWRTRVGSWPTGARRPRRVRPAEPRRSRRSSSTGVVQSVVAHRLVGCRIVVGPKLS